jgi:hypothetical protein
MIAALYSPISDELAWISQKSLEIRGRSRLITQKQVDLGRRLSPPSSTGSGFIRSSS